MGYMSSYTCLGLKSSTTAEPTGLHSLANMPEATIACVLPSNGSTAQLTRFVYSVMGATGTGKSTVGTMFLLLAGSLTSVQFINLISGSTLPVCEGLRSCTAQVQISPMFELAGHNVTLIDTPGFDDTLQTDTQILDLVSTFLADSCVLL